MEEYNLQSINIIANANILESKDFELLLSFKNELQDNFLKAQMFRTRTEMEASVLNDIKFPTPDSKYWQSVREQNVMFQELVMLSYEYRKNLVEIKKLERDMENEPDELEAELMQIEIERKQFIAITHERVAKARIEEIKNWHEIKERIKPELACGDTNVDKHQLVSYTARWVQQFMSSYDSGSQPEKANLLGQLDKGLKLCKEFDIEQKVWDVLGKNAQKQFYAKIKTVG